MSLQIQDSRERRIVAAADALLAGLMLPARLLRTRPDRPVRRILLLRLERIGDLLMTLGAIGAVRNAAPDAAIDLVVGSWNEALAACIPGLRRVETLDAKWLSRDGRGLGPIALAGRARAWRREHYDLAINFEGDIRSHILMALSGAPRRIGFDTGGGGPLLTDVVPFDPGRHVSANAMRLIARMGRASSAPTDAHVVGAELARPADAHVVGAELARPARLLSIPDDCRARAEELLPPTRPLVAIHPSGGREIKQWHPERFAIVARALRERLGATIVLTGAPEDRPLVDRVAHAIGNGVIDLCGRADMVTLAAVLERVDLLITGDTGPLHLAAAVGTPVVALFGPSDPARWGPTANGSTTRATVLRVDLPCSPCNRIRQPPARCVGHVPDCLDGIAADEVTAAAIAILDRGRD